MLSRFLKPMTVDPRPQFGVNETVLFKYFLFRRIGFSVYSLSCKNISGKILFLMVSLQSLSVKLRYMKTGRYDLDHQIHIGIYPPRFLVK